jgi:hypothetical protein
MLLCKRQDGSPGNFLAYTPSVGSRLTSRRAVALGTDAAEVAAALIRQLTPAADLALVVVFCHWSLDPAVVAAATARGLAPARVVGCTAIDVTGPGVRRGEVGAVALGIGGALLQVGVGVARDLSHAALTTSRAAVEAAAAQLGETASSLDPRRHVAITLVDGTCGQEESFCIGSASAAPQLQVVGGAAGHARTPTARSLVFADGEVVPDGGVVIVLACGYPFAVVTSSALEPTELRTVVTAARGRIIQELDGQPAAARFRELVAQLGGDLDHAPSAQFPFARYISNVPYVRTVERIEGTTLRLGGAVDPGQVLRCMRPGDLLGTTRADLARTEARLGPLGAFLAFSCVGRHEEAEHRGLEPALTATYASYPTVGFETFGEQTGLLLVNHTLTGLAIGATA